MSPMTTESEKLSEAEEEYIEALYHMHEEGKTNVKTSELARRLRVSPASVTEMLRDSLAKKDLVKYVPYKGASLTPKGREVAAKIVRKHRIAERLLTDIVGVDWDECHEEACKLEHALSDSVVDKLAASLKNPDTCPHGNIIPPPTGEIKVEGRPLAFFNPPAKVKVVRISREGRDTLRRLASLGIMPGVELKLVRKSPAGGPLIVDSGCLQVAVGRDLAEVIMVVPVDGEDERKGHS
ncbi:MAG: metal-dependent transcriptional regulator [Candidatus Jordarchaeales archaeon]